MKLREVNDADKELLFQWRNDEEYRKNPMNSEFIDWEIHEKWFADVRNSQDKKMFILENSERAIGQIRIEKQKEYWRISYSISNAFRGMGYGRILLTMLENEIAGKWNFSVKLYAEVKTDNIASQRIFEELGYEKKVLENYFIYTKSNLQIDSISEILNRGVLLLSNNRNVFALYEWLSERENVYLYSGKLYLEFLKEMRPKIIISYNYRFMVEEAIINFMEGNIINLHTSYLPWNRGASPNFWSFIGDTPKGVTIHYMNKELDRGKIIVQRKMELKEENETFISSYQKLNEEMMLLFQENWEEIERKDTRSYIPKEEGSYHSKKDLEQFREFCPFSWDENIAQVKARWKGSK